ncbi:MAG: sigma-54 dependent transcriptional regulator [Planctomycetota bacterium]
MKSVLIIDDEATLRRVLAKELGKAGHRVLTAENAAEGLAQLEAQDVPLVLLDLKLPDRSGLEVLPEIKARWPLTEVIVLTGHGTVSTAIEAIRLGAYDYQQKPCDLDELEALLAKALERRMLALQADALTRGGEHLPIEWGQSQAMQQIRRDLEKAAPTDAPVLIVGESGTGKELIARQVHAHSRVADKPFVVVNCGAIPPSLVESTLFGHERGAFTGADKRKLGLVEVADGGTFFLDELGELPPEVQVKLLRFLQSGEVLRVGALQPVHVTVRVVAATNVDIDRAVEQGEFREDLLYRLDTIRLQLPALRDRPGDVDRLVARFLRELEAKGRPPRRFSDSALQALRSYPWPGNVRELRAVIERLCILSEGPEVGVDEVQSRLRGGSVQGGTFPLIPIREAEERLVRLALDRYPGDKPAAADVLGISLKTLYNKIKAFGITDQITPRRKTVDG